MTARAAGTLIIGAGIVGLASAYKLLLQRPGSVVTVVDKEPDVGAHQSGHNSGVLHAGLAYMPGSSKARLAVAGHREMVAFCRDESIPHELCGKLVVATDEGELPRLRALLERGRANGLAGLTWLEQDRLADIEPNVRGVAGVHVPEEGIVDYRQVCRALGGRITSLGGRVVTGAEVRELRRADRGWVVSTPTEEHRAGFLVNCAGLQCDRVARMAGEEPGMSIVPFRGDYYTLVAERRHLVRHLVYPVAPEGFPFLGVHLTRRIDGRVDAGPNAVLALSRETYRKGGLHARDAIDALGHSAVWRFAARHPRMCWQELRRAHSPRQFATALQRLVPAIRSSDLRPGGCGIRAQAMAPDGSLIEDFAFLHRADSLHLLNAPSPAATASLAIGGVIANRIVEAA